MGDAIVITVDRELEDLIPLFLATRQKDIANLDASLAAGDFDTIARIGHGMRGAGGAYGFDAVSQMGVLIERAALARDAPGIRGQIALFRRYMANVQVRVV